MPANASIASRAALVTGGARRIGRAIVLALVRKGYAVAVHARNSGAAAHELCAEIEKGGGRAAVVLGDLADPEAVARLVPEAAAALGPLTLLVNNASEFEFDEIGHLDRTRFDHQLAVNLRAPLFLAEAFAGQAPEDADCSIVNLVDQRVYRPTPRFVSYGLSKSALHTATIMLAQALAPRVRVNAVAPGPILPSRLQSREDFARQCRDIPLGRGPAPGEVAEAVLYLAGAPSVTGETIAVDGGQHLCWRRAGESGVDG